MKLKELVQKFDRGEIVLPSMQRDYVWQPKKVGELMDSLYKGWPIGAFYLWRSQGKHQARDGSAPAVNCYLLDGQQRLTCLARAVKPENGDRPLPIPKKKGQGPLISWRAWFDIEEEKFLLPHNASNEKRIGRSSNLIALSDLILSDKSDSELVLANIEQQLHKMRDFEDVSDQLALTYRGRMRKVANLLDCDATVQEIDTRGPSTADDQEIEQAIVIFGRLNNGGTKLSPSDTQAALLSQQATAHVLPDMRGLMAKRSMQRMGLDFTFATHALITMHRDNAKTSRVPDNWASKDGQRIEKTWKLTEKAIEATVEFTTQNLGWSSSRWIPSVNAILTLVYLAYRKNGALSAADAEAAKKFLCISGANHVFGSSGDTRINKFISKLNSNDLRAKTLLDGFTAAEKKKIAPSDILERQRLNSPLMQVYLAYLVSIKAKSWCDGESLLGLANAQDQGMLSVHHIFPRAYAAQHELDPNLVNSMANYAFLSRSDNSAFRDDEPADRYVDLKAEQKRRAKDQFIAFASDDLMKAAGFEDFLERRAREMAKALNGYLGLE